MFFIALPPLPLVFIFLFFFPFFPSISSIVIWQHQLNICHHAGFAPVFSKYHTNTKMLLSDALIFQASQLGSLCWIRQWLLIRMLKQTNTHRGHSDHTWAWNSKVRLQLWDTEHQRFDRTPGKLFFFFFFRYLTLSPNKRKKRQKWKPGTHKVTVKD